jgi:hypothetical protein
VLTASIRRLHDYLSDALPLRWRIVIADNASTDETLRIAMALAESGLTWRRWTASRYVAAPTESTSGCTRGRIGRLSTM